MDALEPDLSEVVDRRTQADRVDVRARPRFELPGQLVPLGHRDGDATDHVAAVEERTHPLEDRGPSPDHARAGRREHLVPAEDQEVGAEILDVDGRMRYRLRRI